MQPKHIRVGISRRLTRDKDEKSSRLRQTLLAELTPLPSNLPSAQGAACANLLLDLASAEGGKGADDAIAAFLRSPNGNFRKQALRRIHELPTKERLDLLACALGETGDFQMATTLLRIGDTATLERVFPTIERVVEEDGYWLGRLYLLLEAKPPANLDRLRELDAISWLYVCAKLNRPVEEATIVALFADNLFEARSGLIVWCAGRLRAWNALVLMERLTLDPPEDLVRKHWRSLGILPEDGLAAPTRPTY